MVMVMGTLYTHTHTHTHTHTLTLTDHKGAGQTYIYHQLTPPAHVPFY